MPLTDKQIKALKPQSKMYSVTDGFGLSLKVTPNGQKYWRYRYRFLNKAKMLSLGVYPIVTLLEARNKRDDARRLLASGIDPSMHRKAQKHANIAKHENSFEVIAREWFNNQESTWVNSHADKIIRRFERDIFPYLGAQPLIDVTPPQLLEVLRKIEKRGAKETAHRALSDCGRVYRYAIATGRAESDITRDLRGALKPAQGSHLAAITDEKRLGELLRMIDSYQGTHIVEAALKFAPLVFVRPGELRQAKWTDIDLENAQWSYLVQKTQTPHIVPLAKQAVAILKDLHQHTGHLEYVFPSARSGKRPMSDNAILAALRNMGISTDEMCGHGFRATARTLLDEKLHFRADYIEHQLAHAVHGPLGRAYNRTTHLKERTEMMQVWADYLDGLKVM